MNIVGSGSSGRFSVATIPPLCVSISMVPEKDDIRVETFVFTDLVPRFSISFFLLLFLTSERTRGDPPRILHYSAIDEGGIELGNTTTHNGIEHDFIIAYTQQPRAFMHLRITGGPYMETNPFHKFMAFADSARHKSLLATTNALQVTDIITHTRTHGQDRLRRSHKADFISS